MKANWSYIKLLKEEMDQQYVKIDGLDFVKEELEDQKQMILDIDTNFQDKFKSFLNEIKQDNQEYSELVVDNKLKNYNDVVKKFNQFFDQDDFVQLLDRKADIEFIRRLQEQKASKDEIKSFSKILSEMDFKIRHLSVFQ